MRDELQNERSAQPAVAADRNFSAFWLITMQEYTKASNMISCTLSIVELNGIVFGMS